MIELIADFIKWISKVAWNNNEDLSLIISTIGGIIFGLTCAIIIISDFKIEKDGIVTIICCFLFTSGFAGVLGMLLTKYYPITISLVILKGIEQGLSKINDWSIEKAKERKGNNYEHIRR